MSLKAFNKAGWVLDRGPVVRWERRWNDDGEEEARRLLYIEAHQECDPRSIVQSQEFDDFIDGSIIPIRFACYIPCPSDSGGSVLGYFYGTWYIDELDPVMRNRVCHCRLSIRRVSQAWTLIYDLT